MAAWRSTTERKTPRFKRRLDSLAKKPSTALSQEHEVGARAGLAQCVLPGELAPHGPKDAGGPGGRYRGLSASGTNRAIVEA